MNKSFNKIIPREIKIAVFDIESHNWVNPYALGFYDGKNFYKFLGKSCISDFLKFIINYKYRAFTIFAHYGGKFDFNFLIEILKSWNYDFNMIFQGSRCLQLKIYEHKEDKLRNRDNRHCVKFSDSYSLLRFSLDELTKDFNVKHKKINFMDKPNKTPDYEYLYQLYRQKDKRFDEYLYNDVLGLYEVLQKFTNIIYENNGRMSLTIASTSLKTFQSGYLKNKLIMANRKTNDEMKQGYYGGRTEIFRMYLKEGKYKCYDVNSLYPFVMFNNRFPISKPRKFINPDMSMIKNSLGITKAIVTTPKKMYLPLLPYRLEINKVTKLVFPLGKFIGYWDNVLLNKALELGYKVKPLETMVFDGEYIFEDYVKNFHNLKQKTKKNTPSHILAKLMLNSLYGKFGQNQDSECIKKIVDPRDFKKYDITDVFDIDHNLFRVKTESKGNFFLPQISIHVTALALLHLYNVMEKIIQEEKQLAYCDTDSIFTNANLKINNKLGGMKKEYSFKKGYFLLPKTYCIVKNNDEIKVKAKGFISKFQKQIKEKDFKNALFKDDYSGFSIESNEVKFNSIKMSFVRHKTFVSTDKIKKSIKSRYDKRIKLKNFDTIPLIVDKL